MAIEIRSSKLVQKWIDEITDKASKEERYDFYTKELAGQVLINKFKQENIEIIRMLGPSLLVDFMMKFLNESEDILSDELIRRFKKCYMSIFADQLACEEKILNNPCNFLKKFSAKKFEKEVNEVLTKIKKDKLNCATINVH